MIPNVEEQLLKSLTEGITHLCKIHFYFVNYCIHMIFSFTEKLTKLYYRRPIGIRTLHYAGKKSKSKAILILGFIVVFCLFFFFPFSISLGN